MWFQWAELIQVRKEQCLFKCSECMTMQVHRVNFPTSWEQYWEKAPLLWCDPRENPSSCHSFKKDWFSHCTAGLQGSVKLMLAGLLPKILMFPVRLPGVSRACRRMAEKSFAHWQPSGVDALLPCTLHLSCFSTLLVLQPIDSGKICSIFFTCPWPLGAKS